MRSATTSFTSTRIPDALGNVQKRMEEIVLQRNPGDPYEAAPQMRERLQAKLNAV